jgi:hypothetical protein
MFWNEGFRIFWYFLMAFRMFKNALERHIMGVFDKGVEM